MNHTLLEDRVILVTGATGALGSVAAKACAQAGATVVLLGRTVRKLEALYDAILAAGSRKPAIYPLDLAGATETDYAELAEALDRELGGLHGLMHCAAELGHLGPLADIDGVRWQRLLHINLTAPFLLTRALSPLMMKASGGKIIFIGDSAVGDGKAYWGAYGVAKSGLSAYCRILDEESAGFGLRAEVFTPGPMRSRIRLGAYPGESLAALPDPRIHAETIVHLFGRTDLPSLSA